MAGGRADAERLAIPVLSADLRSYGARMQQAQTLVAERFAVAEASAQRAVDDARRRLSSASERLAASRRQDDDDRDFQASEVERAKRHLEAMYAVARDIAVLRTQHQHVARRFATALDTLSQQVQRELSRAGEALDTYLGQSASGPGTSGGAGGDSRAAAAGAPAAPVLDQPAGFPAGVVMVPLALIDDSDSGVHGAQDFGKGYSPADLEWAHEAFANVIVPGLARGLGIDDFRALDERENRMGTRSYADTYSGFFGDSRITLNADGASFRVANGYHRIWTARAMGLDAIPAKVVGP